MKGVTTWTGFTEIPRLHLLPATVDLLRIEDRVHEVRQPATYRILETALAPYLERFELVFLDCPPNLHTTTKNAIFLADSCIVPYVPDYLSLSGFQVLAEHVAELQERFLMGTRMRARGFERLSSATIEIPVTFSVWLSTSWSSRSPTFAIVVSWIGTQRYYNRLFAIVSGLPSPPANTFRLFFMHRVVLAHRTMAT